MSAIVSTIVSAVSSGLMKLLMYAFVAAKVIFKYLDNVRADKAEEKRQTSIRDANAKIDDACDNGTLDDLIDATYELGKANS